MLLITTAGQMGNLSTLMNVWGAEPILHSRSQYLRPLFQVVPMHKPADQPGVGPLPLMSGHVSHLWPTFPMPVQDGSHRGKQFCLENSIQEQISQHQLHPLFYLQQQCCCSHCQCSVDERRCLDQGEFSSSFGPLVWDFLGHNLNVVERVSLCIYDSSSHHVLGSMCNHLDTMGNLCRGSGWCDVKVPFLHHQFQQYHLQLTQLSFELQLG